MLSLKENDLFDLGDTSYITLDSTKYKNEEYIFVNELDKEENPTKKFIVFKIVEDKLVEEKDEKVMRNILPIFSTNMNKKLQVIYEKAMELKEGAE